MSDTATDIVPVKQYALLKPNSQAVLDKLKENVGPEGIGPMDLDRVTNPSGKSIAWMVPSVDGDEAVTRIDGIIIAFRDGRRLWDKNADLGAAPPLCWSDDLQTGTGEPGGSCGKCPLSKFGSANEGQGRGQACQFRRLLFVCRARDFMPLLFDLPPTSAAVCRKYVNRVISTLDPDWQRYVHKLTLTEATNKSGVKYGVLRISLGEKLTDKQWEPYGKLAATISTQVARTDFQADVTNET